MSHDISMKMHEQHREWEADINCWHEDVANWQHDMSRVLVQLQELQDRLKSHEHELVLHASSIQLGVLEVSCHEHAIANAERSGDLSELPIYEAQHMKEKSRHEHQLANHNKVKQEHHAFIASWNQMLKKLALLSPSHR